MKSFYLINQSYTNVLSIFILMYFQFDSILNFYVFYVVIQNDYENKEYSFLNL